MNHAPQQTQSEPRPRAIPVSHEEERGAPPSRVRPRAGREDSPSRDPLDQYYADLVGRRHLTREGEAAIGMRIEAAQRGVIEAWLRSPVAFDELALTAEDVRVGAIALADLLVEPQARDDAALEREARLGRALDRIEALTASPSRRATDPELVAGLAELPLDPTLGDRLERRLRETAAGASAAERAAIEGTLSEIARARRAIARAKRELVEANLRLVIAIARQFRRHDVPLVDLAQEGNIGLIRAVDSFDFRRGLRFSTYAVWWIKHVIRRAIHRQGGGLRMPAHLAEAKSGLARVRRELVGQLGREPTHEEIAERSGMPLARVQTIAELSLSPISLDAPVGEDGDTSIGDHVPGTEIMADEALSQRRMVEQMHDLLDELTPRERDVIERRFGLRGREDETLDEIGRSCSLTRERIRQIEASALEKLRTRSRKRKLGHHADG